MMNWHAIQLSPLLLAATISLAQPAPPPPPPGGDGRPVEKDQPRPRDDRPMGRRSERNGEPPFLREGFPQDPKQAKELLDRLLEENARNNRRLNEAKQKLEGGAAPEEVWRSLREARAGNMADRFFQNWRERQRQDAGAQGPMFERKGGGPGAPDPQTRAELLQFIREIRPEFAEKLDTWQKDAPKAFGMVLQHLMMQAADTFRERDRDKQLYELRKEDLRDSILVVEKSTEVRRMQEDAKGKSDSPEFAKAKAELRELMGKGYDARIRVREYEADKLAKRLDETRARIQETKEVREQMLDRAVTQVLERKRVTPQPGDGPKGPPREGDDQVAPGPGKPPPPQ